MPPRLTPGSTWTYSPSGSGSRCMDGTRFSIIKKNGALASAISTSEAWGKYNVVRTPGLTSGKEPNLPLPQRSQQPVVQQEYLKPDVATGQHRGSQTGHCYRTTGDLLPSTGISAIDTRTVTNTTWSGHLHLLGPLRSFPYPELLIILIIATEA